MNYYYVVEWLLLKRFAKRAQKMEYRCVLFLSPEAIYHTKKKKAKRNDSVCKGDFM